MLRDQKFQTQSAMLLTLVYVAVVVLGTALEYALGDSVAEAWSTSPFVKVLFALVVYSAQEEVLFRVLPVILCITVFDQQGRVTVVGAISSIAYAAIHVPFGYDAIRLAVLAAFGMLLFELCYRMAQNRLERLPTAFMTVFAMHFGYNVALKLLIVFFS